MTDGETGRRGVDFVGHAATGDRHRGFVDLYADVADVEIVVRRRHIVCGKVDVERIVGVIKRSLEVQRGVTGVWIGHQRLVAFSGTDVQGRS